MPRPSTGGWEGKPGRVGRPAEGGEGAGLLPSRHFLRLLALISMQGHREEGVRPPVGTGREHPFPAFWKTSAEAEGDLCCFVPAPGSSPLLPFCAGACGARLGPHMGQSLCGAGPLETLLQFPVAKLTLVSGIVS